MEPINHAHDKGYKSLLSSREIFVQLLRSCIKEPWVKEIDENNVKRTDKTFIAKDYLEKEADLVYEMNLRGKTVVFYILLELQRKVDFSMPYRLLGYMSGIWQNYLNLSPETANIEQKNFRLPAIVPIVLYNGEHPWTAARSFREMLAEESLFGKHVLDFEYILFDVSRYADEDLLAFSNTIGAAFLLDKSKRKPEEMRELLTKLFESLKNASDAELKILLRWMHYVIRPRLTPDQREILVKALDRLDQREVRKMVFENFEKSLDAFKEEGIKEGIEKGIEKGRVKGREEGREEEKFETALAMLRDRVDIDVIAKYTRLPLERIRSLSKKI